MNEPVVIIGDYILYPAFFLLLIIGVVLLVMIVKSIASKSKLPIAEVTSEVVTKKEKPKKDKIQKSTKIKEKKKDIDKNKIDKNIKDNQKKENNQAKESEGKERKGFSLFRKSKNDSKEDVKDKPKVRLDDVRYNTITDYQRSILTRELNKGKNMYADDEDYVKVLDGLIKYLRVNTIWNKEEIQAIDEGAVMALNLIIATIIAEEVKTIYLVDDEANAQKLSDIALLANTMDRLNGTLTSDVIESKAWLNISSEMQTVDSANDTQTKRLAGTMFTAMQILNTALANKESFEQFAYADSVNITYTEEDFIKAGQDIITTSNILSDTYESTHELVLRSLVFTLNFHLMFIVNTEEATTISNELINYIRAIAMVADSMPYSDVIDTMSQST